MYHLFHYSHTQHVKVYCYRRLVSALVTSRQQALSANKAIEKLYMKYIIIVYICNVM
jgi:hypothetical protein